MSDTHVPASHSEFLLAASWATSGTSTILSLYLGWRAAVWGLRRLNSPKCMPSGAKALATWGRWRGRPPDSGQVDFSILPRRFTPNPRRKTGADILAIALLDHSERDDSSDWALSTLMIMPPSVDTCEVLLRLALTRKPGG